MNKKLKILEQKASDNIYLHKDFHGALCYAIKYLDENYGVESTKEYLQQVANTYFRPLIERIKLKGLTAIEEHFQSVFETEGGSFAFSSNHDSLTLTVEMCPAIQHLKKTDQFFTERFCESTVTINETICAQSGIQCTCEYLPGSGKCVQKFWKE